MKDAEKEVVDIKRLDQGDVQLEKGASIGTEETSQTGVDEKPGEAKPQDTNQVKERRGAEVNNDEDQPKKKPLAPHPKPNSFLFQNCPRFERKTSLLMTVGQRLVAGSYVSKASTSANVKTKAGLQATASSVSSKKGNGTAQIVNKARGPVNKGTSTDIF